MKRFLIKIGFTVFPLWLAIVGLVFYYYHTIVPNMQGDLGRLGKIPTKLFYERDSDKAVQKTLFSTIEYIDSIQSDTFDIMTCGDSFSQIDLYGYQNFMSIKGSRIINYFPNGPLRWNPFQSASDLMNLGFIDSTKVKALIIESVERSLYKRLCDLDFTHVLLGEEHEITKHSDDNWNLSEAKIYLDFRLGLKDDEYPVKHLNMKKQLFSGAKGRSLYFYHEDVVENGLSIPKVFYTKIRANVDSLYGIASEKGIRLFILVCPDKYDLYQDYIEDNPYPRKTVNEDFREIVGNRDDIIIGKEILLPYLKKGEKDMYYLDDTHWTYKSAKIIADTLTNLYNKAIINQ